MRDFKRTWRSWQQRSRHSEFWLRSAMVVLAVFGVIGVVMHVVARQLAEEGSDETPTGMLVVPTDSLDGGEGGSDGPRLSPFGFDYKFVFKWPPAPEDSVRSRAYDEFEKALAHKEWRGVVKWSSFLGVLRLTSPLLLLALVAGLVWAIIVAQFAGFSRSQLGLYGVALVLGIASSVLTLTILGLQDMQGIFEGDSFRDQMIHWIAGVGLREEVAKLLCFLPLLIFLRGRSEIDALVAGGIVGLGFAVNENIGYYMRSGIDDAFGRLMTANFLHMAMTAIIARALHRMVLRPKRHWEEFVATFLAVVVFHGLYDAFIAVPELQGFSIMSFVCLAVMAYYFCDLLGKIGRRSGSLAFAPVAVLLIGNAVLAGSVFCFGCLLVSPLNAALMCGYSLLGLFPVVVMFIQRLRDY